MKILLIGPVPPDVGGDTSGGVATHTWGLAAHLVEAGHRVAVLADNLPNGEQDKAKGVRLFGIPRLKPMSALAVTKSYFRQLNMVYKRTHSVSGRLAPLRYFAAVRAVLDEFEPDIVHVHHFEVRYAYSYPALPPHIPVVSTVHSVTNLKYGPAVKQYRTLAGENAADGTPLIFVSDKLKEQFDRLVEDVKGPCHILPNPLDAKKFVLGSRRAARKQIGFPEKTTLALVGSPLEHKGAFLLARAVSLLVSRGRDIHLAVIGDGGDAERFRELLDDLDLTERTTLRRHIDNPYLPLVYNAADLFVMPSRSESFGLVYLEAMLCGTPVVALDNAVPEEVVPHGKVGLLAHVADPEVLAVAVERALEMKWDRKALARHARNFSWQHLLPQFVALYQEIIDNHNALADARVSPGR
ncbi:MAG: glycosyltransferase family 4 protein [Acidobacteriota bacterium]|nr:glycosyltransferase family 4 protein [Acidobacteriota bacterium]